MKIDKVLLAYAGADLLFVLCGALLMVASLVFEGELHSTPTLETGPDILLLKMVPFKGLSLHLKKESTIPNILTGDLQNKRRS